MYNGQLPMTAPVYALGQEPLPPGWTEADRETLAQQKKYQDFFAASAESCVAKTGIAATGGLVIGGMFSLMNSSFQYEDPLLRQQLAASKTTTQRARDVAREMGVNAWRSGRGFAKVGALFAGIECVIEGVRPSTILSTSVRAYAPGSTEHEMTWSTLSLRGSLQVASSHETLGLERSSVVASRSPRFRPQ
jgi:import inner membrane translocase subunit TIM22